VHVVYVTGVHHSACAIAVEFEALFASPPVRVNGPRRRERTSTTRTATRSARATVHPVVVATRTCTVPNSPSVPAASA
jgi:hypothetical protein